MRSVPSWVVPVLVGMLILGAGSALWALASASGKISVLEVQRDTANAVKDRALEGERAALIAQATAQLGEAGARLELSESFAAAAEEQVAATLRQANAQAALIIQEAEGEAAFRRLTGYLDDKGDLIGVRLAEEMDAEFRVQGMVADQALAVSASSLLTAQTRIGIFQVQVDSLITAHDVTNAATVELIAAHERTNAANEAEHAVKDELIRVQNAALAPSFIRKIFDMPEVALFGAAVGGFGVWFLTKDDAQPIIVVP